MIVQVAALTGQHERCACQRASGITIATARYPSQHDGLITGASSGIGLELARVFAESGHDVVLVARREGKLQALAAQLHSARRIRASVIATVVPIAPRAAA